MGMRARVITVLDEENKIEPSISTLRSGCRQLKIYDKYMHKYSKHAPDDETKKLLKQLIVSELSRHSTYGYYSCGACHNDIIKDLLSCPFCGSKYGPIEPIR